MGVSAVCLAVLTAVLAGADRDDRDAVVASGGSVPVMSISHTGTLFPFTLPAADNAIFGIAFSKQKTDIFALVRLEGTTSFGVQFINNPPVSTVAVMKIGLVSFSATNLLIMENSTMVAVPPVIPNVITVVEDGSVYVLAQVIHPLIFKYYTLSSSDTSALTIDNSPNICSLILRVDPATLQPMHHLCIEYGGMMSSPAAMNVVNVGTGPDSEDIAVVGAATEPFAGLYKRDLSAAVEMSDFGLQQKPFILFLRPVAMDSTFTGTLDGSDPAVLGAVWDDVAKGSFFFSMPDGRGGLWVAGAVDLGLTPTFTHQDSSGTSVVYTPNRPLSAMGGWTAAATALWARVGPDGTVYEMGECGTDTVGAGLAPDTKGGFVFAGSPNPGGMGPPLIEPMRLYPPSAIAFGNRASYAANAQTVWLVHVRMYGVVDWALQFKINTDPTNQCDFVHGRSTLSPDGQDGYWGTLVPMGFPAEANCTFINPVTGANTIAEVLKTSVMFHVRYDGVMDYMSVVDSGLDMMSIMMPVFHNAISADGKVYFSGFGSDDPMGPFFDSSTHVTPPSSTNQGFIARGDVSIPTKPVPVGVAADDAACTAPCVQSYTQAGRTVMFHPGWECDLLGIYKIVQGKSFERTMCESTLDMFVELQNDPFPASVDLGGGTSYTLPQLSAVQNPEAASSLTWIGELVTLRDLSLSYATINVQAVATNGTGLIFTPEGSTPIEMMPYSLTESTSMAWSARRSLVDPDLFWVVLKGGSTWFIRVNVSGPTTIITPASDLFNQIAAPLGASSLLNLDTSVVHSIIWDDTHTADRFVVAISGQVSMKRSVRYAALQTDGVVWSERHIKMAPKFYLGASESEYNLPFDDSTPDAPFSPGIPQRNFHIVGSFSRVRPEVYMCVAVETAAADERFREAAVVGALFLPQSAGPFVEWRPQLPTPVEVMYGVQSLTMLPRMALSEPREFIALATERSVGIYEVGLSASIAYSGMHPSPLFKIDSNASGLPDAALLQTVEKVFCMTLRLCLVIYRGVDIIGPTYTGAVVAFQRKRTQSSFVARRALQWFFSPGTKELTFANAPPYSGPVTPPEPQPTPPEKKIFTTLPFQAHLIGKRLVFFTQKRMATIRVVA